MYHTEFRALCQSLFHFVHKNVNSAYSFHNKTKTVLLISNQIERFGAEDRDRTGTVFDHRRILSPVRLPVPPLRHKANIN